MSKGYKKYQGDNTVSSRMNLNHVVASHQTRSRYPIPLPNQIDADHIATSTDAELDALFNSLNDARGRLQEKGYDAIPWEVELSYVIREFQNRVIRRNRHDAYTREQAKLFADEEANLPYGDFDNLKYVNLMR